MCVPACVVCVGDILCFILLIQHNGVCRVVRVWMNTAEKGKGRKNSGVDSSEDDTERKTVSHREYEVI